MVTVKYLQHVTVKFTVIWDFTVDIYSNSGFYCNYLQDLTVYWNNITAPYWTGFLGGNPTSYCRPNAHNIIGRGPVGFCSPRRGNFGDLYNLKAYYVSNRNSLVGRF